MANLQEENVINKLIEILCAENKNLDINSLSIETKSYDEKVDIYRKILMNRELKPVSSEFLKFQNEFLESENEKKQIITPQNLTFSNNMTIVFGDITSIKVDAVVCSCSGNLSVATFPIEKAILTNVILHGGIQIRQDLNFIMTKQQSIEPVGSAKLIKGYHLPAKYVICIVSPNIVAGRVGYREKEGLINCYKSCLNLALEKGLSTIAFSAISTGNKNYPKALAAEIAVSTVLSWQKAHNFPLKVIFCLNDESNISYYETSFKDYDVI